MYVGYQSNTTVASEATYNFTTMYLTNNNINYSNGVFTITKPGWYKIHFDTSASGDNGSIIPTLYVNGTDSAYALAYISSTATTDIGNCSFDTVLKIAPTTPNVYVTLKVVNEGIAATTQASNIIIERLG